MTSQVIIEKWSRVVIGSKNEKLYHVICLNISKKAREFISEVNFSLGGVMIFSRQSFNGGQGWS